MKKHAKKTTVKANQKAAYTMFVKPGDIAFRQGEKVMGFSI